MDLQVMLFHSPEDAVLEEILVFVNTSDFPRVYRAQKWTKNCKF